MSQMRQPRAAETSTSQEKGGDEAAHNANRQVGKVWGRRLREQPCVGV